MGQTLNCGAPESVLSVCHDVGLSLQIEMCLSVKFLNLDSGEPSLFSMHLFTLLSKWKSSPSCHVEFVIMWISVLVSKVFI